MTTKERERKIERLERLYVVGLVLTCLAFASAGILLSLDRLLLGYIMLGSSLLIALVAGTAQVHAAVLTSDQIYIDQGMVPPRYRSKHKGNKQY